MNFEYNPAKSESRKQTNGIRCIQIQALQDDVYLPEIMEKNIDGSRFILDKIAGKHWQVAIQSSDKGNSSYEDLLSSHSTT